MGDNDETGVAMSVCECCHQSEILVIVKASCDEHLSPIRETFDDLVFPRSGGDKNYIVKQRVAVDCDIADSDFV